MAKRNKVEQDRDFKKPLSSFPSACFLLYSNKLRDFCTMNSLVRFQMWPLFHLGSLLTIQWVLLETRAKYVNNGK